MSRCIYCEKCGQISLKPMHPEDVAMGFHRRRVLLRAQKPPEHSIRFFEGESLADLKLKKEEQLATLMCDGCGSPIADGEQAVAVTMWRGDDEPEQWESEYSQKEEA